MPTRSEAVSARVFALVLAATSTMVAGCGEVQVSSANRELIARLATGASTRDLGIVNRVAADLERLKESGGVSDSELEALRPIIERARAGEWDWARDRAYAIRDGQEPSAEDLRRHASRELRPVTTPPSGVR